MKIRAYITHKKAETFADCQDRFGINSNTKSIAVSDGMSQSWQQKIWAKLLVEKFVDDIDWLPNSETIKPLCIQWRERVVEFIEHLKASDAPVNLVYRNERNLADGKSAGATFVGIRFFGIEWKGSVLGDSCLIEWNGDEVSFHTSQIVESFDNHPDYFDSNSLNEGKGTPVNICGVLENNTFLFLVSDPFSDFLFEHNKQGDVVEYMQQLLKISSHEEFEKLVDEWRRTGMHNDDTTLVIVEPDDSEDFSINTNALDDINKLIDEEKKLIEEKDEQIPEPPVPDSNMQTGCEVDKNENVDEERHIQMTETQMEPNQIIIPSDNALEENKKEEETERISVPDSNKQTGCEADTNAVVEESSQINNLETQIESDQIIIPSDNTIEEHKEAEEERPELVPVEAKAFVGELLDEYKNNIDGGLINSLKYAFTEEAVKKAGYSIFEKYNIFNK